MGRIRTVKPELFRHEALFEAEQDYQLPLRLVFIGLFTCCDKEGRFRWRPRQLKLDILPYDDIDFSRVLDALATRGFLVKYEVEGEVYGYIPSWHKHQNINNKEAESNLPSIEDGTVLGIISPCVISKELNESNDFLTRDARVNDASSTRNQPCLESLLNSAGEKEREKEQEGNIEKEKQAKEKVLNHKTENLNESILEIFEFWKTTLNHPNAQLDKKRTICIRQALSLGFNVSQLQEAIVGCSQTPHNLGHNERGERYDGLHVIFKSSDNIERFIRNCHNPPTAPSAAKINLPNHYRKLSDENFENKQYTQTPVSDINWINQK